MRLGGRFTILVVTVSLACCKQSPTTEDGLRGEGEACTADSECGEGGLCVDGICRRPCTIDSHCDEITQHCQFGICMPGSALDCGNGRLQTFEACDDGDKQDGDGCSSVCTVESGWACEEQPSVCHTTCGDSFKAGPEECDDGNVTTGDGCDDACLVEAGWACTGSRSTCAPVCGDGVLAGDETCDDGDTTANDGCSATCSTDAGWSCTGEPSTCACLSGTQDNDHDGTCLPTCATADLSQCTNHGICNDADGVARCDCDANWAGNLCDLCVVFVSLTSASEDGMHWTSAYHNLQTAVTVAGNKGAACEVWIAAGTYPLTVALDLMPSKTHATLYGGFAGGERTREERSSEADITVLDGQQTAPHVIYARSYSNTSTVLLDTLTLTGGNANGAAGTPAARGGGAYFYGIGSVQIRNCVIANNQSSDGGGGLYVYDSGLTIDNSVFDGNVDGLAGGGGMLVRDLSAASTVTQSLFHDNRAPSGGALFDGFTTASYPLTVQRSTFLDNQSLTGNGGALYVEPMSTIVVTAVNSVFVHNSTTGFGGAIYGANHYLTIKGCTFVGNTSPQNGTALYSNWSSSGWSVIGNIIWGKIGSLSLVQRVSGTLSITYSDLETAYTGTGNIAADPLFVAADDFHLQAESPCIDAGNPAVVADPPADFDGVTRICLDASGNAGWDGCPDMGAYEYVP